MFFFATLATAKIVTFDNLDLSEAFNVNSLFAPAPAPLQYPAGTWLPSTSGCYCGGPTHPGADGVASMNSEWAPQMTHIGFGGSFMCNGGCGGAPYVIHYDNSHVVTITAWSGRQCADYATPAITKMCFKFTNGKQNCVGGDRDATCGSGLGTPSSYTFSEGETLSDYIIGGNVKGRSDQGRVAYFKFTTLKADGTAGGWEVGDKATAYAAPLYNALEAINVHGTVFSGFFGKAWADVDQMGALVMKPACTVTHREITGVKCVDTTGNNNCGASWASTEGMIDVHAICDNCGHSNPVECEFSFGWSTTNEVSMSSTQMDSLSTEAGASLTMGISTEIGFEMIGSAEVSAETTFSVSVGAEHSWEQTKSSTTSKTGTVDSACKIPSLPGHKKTIATGTMVVGKLTGHVQFEVTAYTSCGGQEHSLEPVTITIGNVPGVGEVSHCDFDDASCNYEGFSF